ncbi:MAG: ABC transporter ATP-binding protein [Oscillospiraceae bacterium]
MMLEVNGLKKIYNKRKPRGLFETSFTAESGSIVGLLGENGAGKTTLLRCMSGLCAQGGGTVLLDGKAPYECGEDISYITGEGSYLPALRVKEYGEFLQDMHCNFDIARYVKLCDFFSLDYSAKINKMSTGERAKVELAAGFAKKAKYIFMDEPFLGKDVFTRLDFLKLMSGALRGGETIFLCTHYIDEIEHFIERAIIMHNGKISADISVEQLHAEGVSLIDKMADIAGWDAQKYLAFDD